MSNSRITIMQDQVSNRVHGIMSSPLRLPGEYTGLRSPRPIQIFTALLGIYIVVAAGAPVM